MICQLKLFDLRHLTLKFLSNNYTQTAVDATFQITAPTHIGKEGNILREFVCEISQFAVMKSSVAEKEIHEGFYQGLDKSNEIELAF